MDPLSLHEVAAACGGELLQGAPETTVARVCTDSRQVEVGDLFVALQGEKFDAHDYLADVARRGAAAVLIARRRAGGLEELGGLVGVIAVDDTRAGLGRLAGWYRERFRIPVVAVAGSNGKTTTKELIAAILRQMGPALWSEASFNNDVGVPLTLLRLERTHRAAVLEVGTNHPGELRPLLQRVRPVHGVLTNIGREHLEFFGDLAGVAQEEGTLAEILPATGKFFLNGDNEWAPAIARRTQAACVRVGLGSGNDWQAEQIRVGEDGVRFDVRSPYEEFSGEYRLRLLGRHQVPNALLALAAGKELGATPQQARGGLAECPPPKMRLQLWGAGGVRILDDAYNANADSMQAALETLKELPCQGRRLAVLGDMAELGPHSAAAHREIGRRCAELRIDQLIAVGRFAGETAQAARAAGLHRTLEFSDVSGAAQAVGGLVRPGDLVLLKASRATGLERVGEVLKRGGPAADRA